MLVTCKKCGTANAEAAKFCNHCGDFLASQISHFPPAATIDCLQCGTANAPEAKFCMECGFDLSQPVAPQPVSQPERANKSLPDPDDDQTLILPNFDPLALSKLADPALEQTVVLPVNLAPEAPKSASRLYMGIGGVAVVLLGMFIWVLQGVKSGELAPPSSVQASNKLKGSSTPQTEISPPITLPEPVSVVANQTATVVASVVAKEPEKEEFIIVPAAQPRASQAQIKKPAAPMIKPKPLPGESSEQPAPASGGSPVASAAVATAQASPAQASTPRPPAVTQTVKAADATSPREACSARSFLMQPYCIQQQCNTQGLSNHPQCVQMRQQQREAQERISESNR